MGQRTIPTLDRRTMLALLGSGSAAALAGCSGGGDQTPTGTASGGVPEQYRTATGLDGQQRDPSALSTQGAVNYQSQPQDGQQCSGCAYYIPDKNGDGVGACTIVEGTIEPSGYCTSYVAHEGSETATEGESQAAVDVPEDARCAVCDMMAANFPEWNAQAVHDDDTRAFFCTSGCATTYYAVPDQFAETDADITGLWVRDLNSQELVDGMAAYYALETDGDRLDDPMQVNPAPFAAREDAVSYVDEVGYLTEDDIVELTAFDSDLAEQYRGQLIE